MPEVLLKKIFLKIKKRWKIAFFSAFLIGFITHLFVFTNILPNHDGINNLHNEQMMSISGRFFLHLFAGLSSYFDLPIINGILGTIYLSILSVIIIELFNLKKTLSIILISGLIVTFPTIASTFSYMYTADGYMLSYLVTALAIIIAIRFKYGFLFGTILFYLSVGVYQVNLPFALSLITLWFIMILLYENKELKKQIISLSKLIIMITVSMVVYVISFKIYQRSNKIVDYQGLDKAGSISFHEIPYQLNLIIETFINFFIGDSYNFFEWLNIILLILILIGGVYVLSQQFKVIGLLKTLIIILCAFILPLLPFSLFLISTGVKYHMLMVISLLVFYFIPIIFYDFFHINTRMTKVYSWTTVVVLTLTVFNFSLISNISYLNASLKYEKNYALANRILDRVEQLDGIESVNKIAVIGNPGKYYKSDFYRTFVEKTPHMTGLYGQSFIRDTKRLRNTLDHYFGVNFIVASESEIKELENNMVVEEMSIWPASDSITIINDTIVIKFPK